MLEQGRPPIEERIDCWWGWSQDMRRTAATDARRAAEKIRRKLSDRDHSDSAQLIGEDRSR
jgi:hypothetical protein